MITTFLLMSLILTASTAQPMSASHNELTPFDYIDARERTQAGDDEDKRHELGVCVENWRGFAATRANVFRSLEAAGFLLHGHSLLLEVGSSGFGYYNYIAVIDGNVVDFGNDGRTRMPSRHVRAIQHLMETLNDRSIIRMQGAASSSVMDGTCYFLTITLSDGRSVQAAVYGPPLPRSFAGRTIKALLPFLRRVNPTELLQTK